MTKEYYNIVEKFLPFYILHPDEPIYHDHLIYADLWERDNNQGDIEHFVSYYISFFENGEISACPSILSSKHKGDIEHITVCYEPETLRIKYIYYFAHGSQGTKLGIFDIPCVYNTSRPIVYIALNSHASYPTGGTKWRMLGLANDVCATTDVNIFNPLNYILINYAKEETETIQKIKDNAYYRRIPYRTFNWFERMFLIWT